MINETFLKWKDYISNHPEKRSIVDDLDIHYSSYGECAPYKDLWVACFHWNTIIFSKYCFNDEKPKNAIDSWHRLDGPAYISATANGHKIEYYLDGVRHDYDSWKNNFYVKMVLFEKCLRDIMLSDE